MSEELKRVIYLSVNTDEISKRLTQITPLSFIDGKKELPHFYYQEEACNLALVLPGTHSIEICVASTSAANPSCLTDTLQEKLSFLGVDQICFLNMDTEELIPYHYGLIEEGEFWKETPPQESYYRLLCVSPESFYSLSGFGAGKNILFLAKLSRKFTKTPIGTITDLGLNMLSIMASENFGIDRVSAWYLREHIDLIYGEEEFMPTKSQIKPLQDAFMAEIMEKESAYTHTIKEESVFDWGKVEPFDELPLHEVLKKMPLQTQEWHDVCFDCIVIDGVAIDAISVQGQHIFVTDKTRKISAEDVIETLALDMSKLKLTMCPSR